MRFKYLLYMVIPVLLGFLYSFSSYINILTVICAFAVPIIFMLIWIFVGVQFADFTDNPIIAILLSHLSFILNGIFHYFKLEATDSTILKALNFFISKASLCISPLIQKLIALIKIPSAASYLVYLSLAVSILFFLIGYIYNYQKFVRSRYQFHKNLFR